MILLEYPRINVENFSWKKNKIMIKKLAIIQVKFYDCIIIDQFISINMVDLTTQLKSILENIEQ